MYCFVPNIRHIKAKIIFFNIFSAFFLNESSIRVSIGIEYRPNTDRYRYFF